MKADQDHGEKNRRFWKEEDVNVRELHDEQHLDRHRSEDE